LSEVPALPSLSLNELPAAIERLTELSRRRRFAELQEKLASVVFDPDRPLENAYSLIEDSLRDLRPPSSSVARIENGAALAQDVLSLAARRLEQRRATGKPVTGIPTGLARLDQLVNGWFPGLHVIAAGPGVGKTTLCLQFAWEALRAGFPVLYVTYENAPRNLLLKLLCARAGLSPADVERGFADMDKLLAVEEEHAELLNRFHLVEGDGRLRLDAVESALRNLLPAGRQALIIFDYLQRAAHSLGYEQLRQNVSLLTGELRDLSTRLDCPLIAISSQNRAAGDYGKGGSGSLDSLKESGDLEYGADTVSLLYSPNDASAAPPARELELKVAKNRFGAVGQFRLIFRPDTGVFREKA
jgi:replicative DNA helicase